VHESPVAFRTSPLRRISALRAKTGPSITLHHANIGSRPLGGGASIIRMEFWCPAELRATANLLSRVRLIWLVQSHLQKYFCSPRTQITPISAAIPPHLRGVSRSSRTLGAGCDGREDAADEQRMRGRRSRVVLTPRRWRQAGGVIRRRRWQTSPVTEESTKETVKTIACGNAG
jgi:hypothetical protein